VVKPGLQLLARAAGLSGLTLLSSALGFAREILIAHHFGASHATDAYLVAVSVPALIYALLFGSGLNVSVVPRLAVVLRDDWSRGRTVFAQFLSGAAFWSALGSCVIALFPEVFVRIFAPGMAGSQTVVEFLRILSPLLFLLVISFGLGSYHCANDQVSHWGLIPVVQNLTLVLALIAASRLWGMKVLVAGTLGGALLSFLLQARLARGGGFAEAWTNPFRAGDGRSLLAGMIPFALACGLGGDFGTSQADIFLIRFFGSSLQPGSITLLALGNKLMGLPVLFIGAALGLALLPSLSVAVANRDQTLAGSQLAQGLSYALLLACPIAVIYFDMGEPIVRLIFRHTALAGGQLGELGLILHGYAGAVIGLAVVYILNSYLAALRRTRALIGGGVFTAAVELLLMGIFRHWYGTRGIALAVSAGSLVYCATLMILLARDMSLSLRWRMLERAAVISAGAAAMHGFLRGAMRVNVFMEMPWLGGGLLPLVAGMAAYLGWLALYRIHLQMSGRRGCPAAVAIAEAGSNL
jgi:putative peptidoglycan lipid II flippase